MATVVVTGAHGFIGSRLVRRLVETGVEVVAVRRPGTTSLDVPSVALDDGLAALSNVDAVFHVGGHIAHTHASADDAEASIEGNVLFTRSLLRALPSAPRRLVFVSTIDVYAQCAEPRDLDELAPIGPATLYAASKYFAEKLISSYQGENPGMSAIIARLTHVYGEGEPSSAKLVPTAIAAALRGEPPRLAGNPNATRDLIHVDDVAEALRRTFEAEVGGTDVVNIASGRSHTVREILDRVTALASPGGAGRLEWPAEQETAPARFLAFDVTRMRDLLGAWTMVPFEQGLEAQMRGRQ